MNIVDALKSGMPWKRKGGHWSWRDPIVRTPGYNGVHLELSDLLADDWEIKKPSITITRDEFLEAVRSIDVTIRDHVSYKQISLEEYLTWPITGGGPLRDLLNRLGLG